MGNAPRRAVARIVGASLTVLLLAMIGPATVGEPSRVMGRLTADPPVVATRPSDPVLPVDPGLPAEIMGRVPAFDPAPPAVPVPPGDGPKAMWLSRIPTDQPVAFITIDDGWVKLPEAAALVKAARVPVTLFLT